jgi:dTDP-4-dehydrorhamnose 3,5-epimerase
MVSTYSKWQMAIMKGIKTRLEDCVIIEPEGFGDERGFFIETF